MRYVIRIVTLVIISLAAASLLTEYLFSPQGEDSVADVDFAGMGMMPEHKKIPFSSSGNAHWDAGYAMAQQNVEQKLFYRSIEAMRENEQPYGLVRVWDVDLSNPLLMEAYNDFMRGYVKALDESLLVELEFIRLGTNGSCDARGCSVLLVFVPGVDI